MARTAQPDSGIAPDVMLPIDPARIGLAADPVIEAAAGWCTSGR
ncbi:hypothetical protein [uncultured Erythrobacter sp.]|nr:hypothetical protein [uncultured Erythrobacter sp.]